MPVYYFKRRVISKYISLEIINQSVKPNYKKNNLFTRRIKSKVRLYFLFYYSCLTKRNKNNQNKTKKSFSPIGCAINDKFYRFLTIWKLPNTSDCLMTVTTAWRLPNAFLMTAWWLSDNYSTTAWPLAENVYFALNHRNMTLRVGKFTVKKCPPKWAIAA